jgi:hypothetical protein
MFRSVGIGFALLVAIAVPARAGDTPGVTPTAIKIGGVFPFSGPASSIGQVGRGVLAYVQSINDRGGINGRKINYVTLDDAYSPPKAFEHTRRLVENDDIAFMRQHHQAGEIPEGSRVGDGAARRQDQHDRQQQHDLDPAAAPALDRDAVGTVRRDPRRELRVTRVGPAGPTRRLGGLCCLGASVLCMNRRGFPGAGAGMHVHFFRRERRVAFRADHHGVEHVTAGLVLMHHGTSA